MAGVKLHYALELRPCPWALLGLAALAMRMLAASNGYDQENAMPTPRLHTGINQRPPSKSFAAIDSSKENHHNFASTGPQKPTKRPLKAMITP